MTILHRSTAAAESFFAIARVFVLVIGFFGVTPVASFGVGQNLHRRSPSLGVLRSSTQRNDATDQSVSAVPSFLIQAFEGDTFKPPPTMMSSTTNPAAPETPFPAAAPDAAATSVKLASSFPMTTTASSSSSLLQAECDDSNHPPSLRILLRSLHQLTATQSSTDIRGHFVDHGRWGSVAAVAHELGRLSNQEYSKTISALTPFVAFCLGRGLADLIEERQQQQQVGTIVGGGSGDKTRASEPPIADDFTTTLETQQEYLAATSSAEPLKPQQRPLTIVVGQDPRPHGRRIVDSLARGIEESGRFQVWYAGIATTPACATMSRLLADEAVSSSTQIAASVMVTASHLPLDRNGMKLFWGQQQEDTKNDLQGASLNKDDIRRLGELAASRASQWYTRGILPPSSGEDAVMCTRWIDSIAMPKYAQSLRAAIQNQVGNANNSDKPLEGLTIVLNAGHGSGGFFQQVLESLGANVDGSVGTTPDSTFPLGVPNPEYKPMVQATVEACREAKADLGIMLDTDADRCGFIVPSRSDKNDNAPLAYEPLHRNRLIALLGVIFADTSPGCTIVTDSVTSEGLTTFLQDKLGLSHYRYLKGYNNVIGKAKEIDADLAIETSGHCAMKENYYLDDGTFTAVKVVSLLARENAQQNENAASSSILLDLIQELVEMPEVAELRMEVVDKSLETTRRVFEFCALELEQAASSQSDYPQWQLDTDNLEGIRVRVANATNGDGAFFMLRLSLHDPIISLQVEAHSQEQARTDIVKLILRLFQEVPQIQDQLRLTVLEDY